MSAWAFTVGPVMSQATPAVHGLIGFLNFIFFAIKQAKMDFVFKLSFFLQSVTNQNFKKKIKIFYHKQGKNREKKKKESG